MSAKATTPTVWPLAEAMIRHRAGSDDQGDGSFRPFSNQAVGVVARTRHSGEEGATAVSRLNGRQAVFIARLSERPMQ